MMYIISRPLNPWLLKLLLLQFRIVLHRLRRWTIMKNILHRWKTEPTNQRRIVKKTSSIIQTPCSMQVIHSILTLRVMQVSPFTLPITTIIPEEVPGIMTRIITAPALVSALDLVFPILVLVSLTDTPITHITILSTMVVIMTGIIRITDMDIPITDTDIHTMDADIHTMDTTMDTITGTTIISRCIMVPAAQLNRNVRQIPADMPAVQIHYPMLTAGELPEMQLRTVPVAQL
jgi:hypothetical protein